MSELWSLQNVIFFWNSTAIHFAIETNLYLSEHYEANLFQPERDTQKCQVQERLNKRHYSKYVSGNNDNHIFPLTSLEKLIIHFIGLFVWKQNGTFN